MRDEFSAATKDLLARRVGFRCSNPDCRQPTSGPQAEAGGSVNIGAAAHITAASPDGPRYDAALSAQERSAAENGVWLCQTDAKLVDNDDTRFPVAVLREWKKRAEVAAARDLSDRFPGIPIPLERLVRLAAGCADRTGLSLPTPADFTAELVCLPEDYRHSILRRLETANRCVLLGRAASGKTWIASAFVRWLELRQGRTAYYVDAYRSAEGDGRVWYQEAARSNPSHPVIVIDNCHAAPDEVGEFCRLVEGAGAHMADTSIILVATADHWTGTPPDVDDPTLLAWAVRYEVAIRAEDIWRSMVLSYGRFLRNLDPSKYGDVTDDLATDPDGALDRRHGHDLAASRARLESWRSEGGSLPALSDATFYGTLRRRYLDPAPGVMKVLCTLWGFEVPAHQRFLESFAQAVERLAELKLISSESSDTYGRCFRPAIHPSLARAVTQAHLWHDSPQALQGRGRETAYQLSALRDYLITRPTNAVRLYSALRHGRHDGLCSGLLRDDAVVEAGLASLGDFPAYETAQFLSLVHSTSPATAAHELTALKADKMRVAALAAGLQMAPTWRMLVSLSQLSKIDDALAATVTASLDESALARGLGHASPRTVESFLTILSRSYPHHRLRRALDSLDADALATQGYDGRLQKLCWLVRSLDRFSIGRIRDRRGKGQQYLRALGGPQLARVFRRGPSASDFDLFVQVAAPDIRGDMLAALSTKEMVELLEASHLREWPQVVRFARAAFRAVRSAGGLQEKVRSVGAGEIADCLHACARRYSDVHRVLEQDVVAALGDPVTMRTVLSGSDLRGVQRLISDLAAYSGDPRAQCAAGKSIETALGEVDLGAGFRSARLSDAGYFVWNLYEHVNAAIALHYAPGLEEKLRDSLPSASLADVLGALWTLVKVVDDAAFVKPLLPALEARTVEAGTADSDAVLPIVGCVETLLPGGTSAWKISGVDVNAVPPATERWLLRATPDPSVAALVLVGAARLFSAERVRDAWSPERRCWLMGELRVEAKETASSVLAVVEGARTIILQGGRG